MDQDHISLTPPALESSGPRPKRIVFVGYGRAGKDEAASFLSNHCGLKYGGSTSWAALPFMAEYLKVHPMTAWETRHEDGNRMTWKWHCDYLRREDPCFLIRRALQTGDIITGIRGLPEIDAAIQEKLFDHIVWISNLRVPQDPTVDYGVEKSDTVICNNGTLEEYHMTLMSWAFEKNLGIKILSSYGIEIFKKLSQKYSHV